MRVVAGCSQDCLTWESYECCGTEVLLKPPMYRWVVYRWVVSIVPHKTPIT